MRGRCWAEGNRYSWQRGQHRARLPGGKALYWRRLLRPGSALPLPLSAQELSVSVCRHPDSTCIKSASLNLRVLRPLLTCGANSSLLSERLRHPPADRAHPEMWLSTYILLLWIQVEFPGTFSFSKLQVSFRSIADCSRQLLSLGRNFFLPWGQFSGHLKVQERVGMVTFRALLHFPGALGGGRNVHLILTPVCASRVRCRWQSPLLSRTGPSVRAPGLPPPGCMALEQLVTLPEA